MNAIKTIAENARQTCRKAEISADFVMPSPCLSVCKMDAERVFCQGCLRTIDEITRWSRMDDAGKLAIWRLIAERADKAVA